MIYVVIIALALVIFLALWLLKHSRRRTEKRHGNYNSHGFDRNGVHINGTKYDDEGYDRSGYNADGYNRKGYNTCGKNVKGQYNRFFDMTSGAEEGFEDPRLCPIALTDHAYLRISERLGIHDRTDMYEMAYDAYRYGKSKRQIMRTSAMAVEEIEQKHDGSIVLIFRNHIFVFSPENVLITVYKNDRIRL